MCESVDLGFTLTKAAKDRTLQQSDDKILIRISSITEWHIHHNVMGDHF